MRLLLAPAAAVLTMLPAMSFAETATFDIVLRGLRVGELSYSATVTDRRYAVTGRLATTGLIGALRKVGYTATASGSIDDGQLRPRRYEERAEAGSRESSSQMVYADGVPAVTDSGKRRKRDVDPETQGGTVDPMTAIYAVLRDLPARPDCNLRFEMFDGHRSSVVQLSRNRTMPQEIVCDGAYVRVGGFSKEEMAERTRFPFTLRYVPAGGGTWRVAEVQTQTLFGIARLLRR